MSGHLAANWGVHLLHAGWQSAVVAGVAIAAVRALPRVSSRLRYALLLLALVKFAVPPMLALPSGLFSSGPGVGSAFFWPAERPFVLGPAGLTSALLAIHALGAAVVATLLVFRTVRLWLLVRRAAPAEVWLLELAAKAAAPLDLGLLPRIVVSAEATSPFVCGAWDPAVVIPRSLGSPSQRSRLADVLAHELCHVAARDPRDRLLEALLLPLWWWSPIFWLLSAELRRVREERCDDLVLALSLSSPRRYSLSLIEVARAAGREHGAIAMGGEPSHPLAPRLRRLADRGLTRSPRLGAGQLALVALGALLILPGVRPRGAVRVGVASGAHVHQHSH